MSPIASLPIHALRGLMLLVLAQALPCAEVIRIELRDVQALFGGQDIVVRKDGVVLTTEVREGMGIYRDGKIPFAEVLHQIDPAQLEGYVERVRMGLVDEARLTIRIYSDDGTVKAYEKWANDRDAAFDKVYRALLRLMKIDGLQTSKGPYDWNCVGEVRPTSSARN